MRVTLTLVKLLLVVEFLSVAKVSEVLSCVISSNATLVTTGKVVSLSCNARPNNEPQGVISNLMLASDGGKGVFIYQPPVFDSKGKASSLEVVAKGYKVEHLGENIDSVTIQINRSQLTHGGTYICNCAGTTSSRGNFSLVVIGALPTLALCKGNDAEARQIRDLDCSISFNGSSSSVFFDICIFNATSEMLANRSNLPLLRNISNYHLTYRDIDDPNQEQNYTCEMKVWTKSRNEKTLLYSSKSILSLNLNGIVMKQGVSKPIWIGVSVGVPVGIAVLSLITGLLVSQRRNNRPRPTNTDQKGEGKQNEPNDKAASQKDKTNQPDATSEKK